jgi:DNA-binding NtrC family response regulator
VVLCQGEELAPEDFPQICDAGDGGETAPAAAAAAVQPLERRNSPSMMDREGEIRPLAEVEADMIRLAIEHYDGRMSLVARRLGIGRSTLYRKVRELGLDAAE